MERVIDELEMISSPLAESEDSLISDMSTRNDVTRASWLEYRGIRRRIEDGNESDLEDDESDVYAAAPPIPERDYSRFRPIVYRKHGEEFSMRRSKSYERPGRARTPEKRWTRNARSLVDKTKKQHVYATPIRQKITSNAIVNSPIIEEFSEEVPRYVRPLKVEETVTKAVKETKIEVKEEEEEEEEAEEEVKEKEQIPVLDMSTEIEFSSKIERPIGKLTREDSLTELLKRQLSSKNHHRIKEELPEYVEPKDPIIKELQEFLKIEPKSSEESSHNSTSNSIEKERKEEPPLEKEKTVQADEHRLIVRGWQELLKSSSSSSSSSTSSTTV